MSRTKRRVKHNVDKTDKKYFCSELKKVEGLRWQWFPFVMNSPEYKKGSAKFHSDSGTHNCKEPGPKWFRNLYAERPHRRSAKLQLTQFCRDEEFEVIILDKPKLPYWT